MIVDIVGTDNILAEVECITIVHHALKHWGFMTLPSVSTTVITSCYGGKYPR